MNFKKIVSGICTVAFTASLLVGFNFGSSKAPVAGQTPRNETFYMSGIQWGAPASFNPMDPNPAFPIALGSGREIGYETLFMFNQLTGGLEPLLGTKYAWNGGTLTVTMNKDAHWNDGKKLTAADVAYTFNLSKKYDIQWKGYWDYLTSVTAPNATTVVFKLNAKMNRLTVLESLQSVYILPQHIWSAVEKTAGNNLANIRKVQNMKGYVGSGPYKLYAYNDTKITVIRDDKYWGQAKSAFGKLPAPKYITHNIFKDNVAGDLAFKNGEVDMSQQFTPKVWLMWQGGAPVKTYLKNAPYFIAGSIPQLIFNTTKPGLDNASVRKAIAMCIDFKKISDIAMSGYSAAMVPGLNLLTAAEQSVIDAKALKPLQYTYDIAAANKLLDSIGAAKGADGIRELNGVRLGPWNAECPFGWADWNASLEIVSQSAKAIGIEIQTKFPEAPVWTTDRTTGNFDMIMDTPGGGPSMSQPWARARALMSSVGVGAIGVESFWNYGRYKNARADAIIAAIPSETNATKLKSLYTELNKIYLTDVPTVGLMYRPGLFYTVNEKVWSGFPVQGDGSNIPPQICTDGAGIKALYKIKANKK